MRKTFISNEKRNSNLVPATDKSKTQSNFKTFHFFLSPLKSIISMAISPFTSTKWKDNKAVAMINGKLMTISCDGKPNNDNLIRIQKLIISGFAYSETIHSIRDTIIRLL